MLKKLLYFICIFHASLAAGQDCPVLTNPTNGAVDIPVDATITWTEADPSVPGYIISIGTTPGGTNIVDQQALGRSNSYVPPLGLPENTEIFVTLTLFFFNQSNITCNSESFTTVDVTTKPECTSLTNPVDGAINVNTTPNIAWNYASTATGYRISIGTTPGGIDILNNQDVGNTLIYKPDIELPSSTLIYVLIVPYNENGDAVGCVLQSFTTGEVVTIPPGCATMISPANGEVNVTLTPFLEWTPVAGATGYKVTIGYSPFTAEILDKGVFPSNAIFVIDFEPSRTFFITIVPFNDAGDATGCVQESFTTSPGCGPFIDEASGEEVSLNPEIDFPDTIPICENASLYTTSTTDTADGYRWYKIDQFGNETLISDTADVLLMDIGDYKYEAYNTFPQTGGAIECPTSKIFEVVSSEVASISDINISEGTLGLRIEVFASGIGDYQYALDNQEGPYQDSSVFTNITPGGHTVYVRDKNGCGVVKRQIDQGISAEEFPRFFTPNGDGINDFWQFTPALLTGEKSLNIILIFDRLGTLITQIDPISLGWDGNYNGQPLPSSDYWFKARDNLNNEIRGHFTLKR